MNEKEFKKAVESYVHSNPMDVRFLGEWFRSTLTSLVETHKQQTHIKHPRHRGDAREGSFSSILENMLPPKFNVAKGYAVNRYSTTSNEQDIIVFDSSISSKLAGGGSIGYYPIEGVLGSVEVKSNLNLKELRKSFINCISLKRVLHGVYSDDKEKKCSLFYGIFAFNSSNDLAHLADQVNKECESIPYHLRPNALYILGKGALVPTNGSGFGFTSTQFFLEGPFKSFSGIGTKKIQEHEGYAFLYFLCGLIDHCVLEAKIRLPPSLMMYMSTPIIFQYQIEKLMEKEDQSKKDPK